MSEKILFAHHHEPYWEEGLNKYGTSFEKEHLAIIDHILFSGENYDKVITTSFKDISPEGIDLLIEVCNHKSIEFEHQCYGYGMIRDEHSIDTYPIEELNDTWCFGNRNYDTEEDVLDIHDWMKDLKGSEVNLVGAFEGECLNDMETIFDSININYSLIPPLCVGPSQPEYSLVCEEKIMELQSELIMNNSRIEDEFFESLDKYDVADFEDLMEEYPKVAYKHLGDFCDEVEKYTKGLDELSESIDITVIKAMMPETPIIPDLECCDDSFNEILEKEIEGERKILDIRKEIEALNKKSRLPSPSYSM